MDERIKKLRKTLHLTQQEFADRIGVARGNIATYETGKSNPGDAVVALICREFSVNEAWLRTGEGDMFTPVAQDDQITDFMGDLLKNEDASFKRRFVAMLSRLSESDWEVLEKMALTLAGEDERD